jgi:ATP-binding cassette subfamily B (MDR/TAP) protein 1
LPRPPLLSPFQDECTSALDAISRVLVFEAIKRWRRNQTTIVITHDLSQITPTDFVYLLKDGHIVEEGFRADLIRLGKEFSRMAAEQTISPLPEDDGDGWDDGEEILDAIAAEEPESTLFGFNLTVPVLGTGSASATRRPPSVSYFDILNGYSSGSENNRYSSMALNRSSYSTALDSSPNYTRDSWLPKTSPTSLSFPTSVQSFTNRLTRRASQLQLKPPSAFPSTLHKQQSLSALNVPTINVLNADQRSSWQAFQSSMSADSKASSLAATSPWDLSREQSNVDLPSISISNAEGNADFASELERQDLEKRGEMASRGRAKLLYPGSRIKRDSIADEHVVDIVPKRAFGSNAEKTKSQDPSIVKVIFSCVPSIPHKFVLLMAFVTAIGHGVCTPLWSSYLSKLMALVAAGGTDTAALTKNSVIVLCLSAADGLCVGVSFVAFEYVSYCWITELRDRCFGLIIAQDKSWFDRPENSPATIVQSLIKDGDDMLPIVATIPGHFITAVVMIGVGTIWAVTLGWKLTLIGVAVIPVFCVAIGLQFMLLNNIELRNKRMREEVAKIFYEVRSLPLRCLSYRLHR